MSNVFKLILSLIVMANIASDSEGHLDAGAWSDVVQSYKEERAHRSGRFFFRHMGKFWVELPIEAIDIVRHGEKVLPLLKADKEDDLYLSEVKSLLSIIIRKRYVAHGPYVWRNSGRAYYKFYDPDEWQERAHGREGGRMEADGELLLRETADAYLNEAKSLLRRDQIALADEQIDKAIACFASLDDFRNYLSRTLRDHTLSEILSSFKMIEVYEDADINKLPSHGRNTVILAFIAKGFKDMALENLLSIENEDERDALATRIEDITTAKDRGEAWENYRDGKRASRPIHRDAGAIEAIKQEMEKQLTRIDRAQRVLDKALEEDLEAEYIERYKADLNIQKAMLWGWEMRLEDTKKELVDIKQNREKETSPAN